MENQNNKKSFKESIKKGGRFIKKVAKKSVPYILQFATTAAGTYIGNKIYMKQISGPTIIDVKDYKITDVPVTGDLPEN